MTIRSYRPGDEEAQAAIYNEAAGELPKFKSASVNDVRRRCQARDFDPKTRLYAEVNGQIVGYVTFQPNGRVGFPWCRKGHENQAEPLFAALLAALKQYGLTRAFAAYRGDWPTVLEFLAQHGFEQSREMVNFVLDLVDMPTPTARPELPFSELRHEDVAHILQLGAGVVKSATVGDLEREVFHSPYFGPDSFFVLRHTAEAPPLAVGCLVKEIAYADPKLIDPFMPCFRLGAFGTEGMTTKRINGLFSFVTKGDRDVMHIGLTLLGHAAFQLSDTDLNYLAAQVPSDAPHLLRFYQRIFQKQGSFPILEKSLQH
jgi:hypothetical protein